MKKFFSYIRRNIFYFALITGMVALVAMVALYNVRMESGKKKETTTQETADAVEHETSSQVYETIGQAKDKTNQNVDGEATDADVDNTEDASQEKDTTENDSTEGTENSSESSENDETRTETTLTFDDDEAMMWPLNGNIIIPFSMDTTVFFETLGVYKCNPGMVIEAAAGDEAVAAYKCLVTDISSSPVYGNMVTADVGNGYQIVYGGLGDVKVAKGQVVEAGTTIGLVGEATRYFEKEGPNLYFAITKDGKPVDPAAVIE